MDRTFIGFVVFFGLGVLWAGVSDWRRWRRRRRERIALRQRHWHNLYDRGYEVIPYRDVDEHGPLIRNTAWNKFLAEREDDQPAVRA
jgi:hypothetical protein